MSLIQGVVTGIVTSNDDPLKQGRIKVHFRWLGDDHETDWIRIATTMAGPGKGSFFIPEVKDEVLCAFEHGDVRFPYVVGFMWNGVDATPASDVRDRQIVSKNGHRIRFVDSTEKNGDKGLLMLEDASGGRITMSNGKIAIQSKGVLELNAPIISITGMGGWRRTVTGVSSPV